MKDDQWAIPRLRNRGNNRTADGNVIRRNTVHPAHHPHPFGKIDQRDIVRLQRRARMDRCDRIDCARAARLNPFERLPFRPANARREKGRTTGRIALQQYPAFIQRFTPAGFGARNIVGRHAALLWALPAIVNHRRAA